MCKITIFYLDNANTVPQKCQHKRGMDFTGFFLDVQYLGKVSNKSKIPSKFAF